uniref:ATPase AAA-type core domain-containing protein n=1 Tax=viral metagenome TaxID=1070528 RepID=A0A6C0F483_9ZZZZ
MDLHILHNWEQYLKQDDYNYLIQYVENVKNNIPNDKMIILSGKPRTGKTSLKKDISNYLGFELCGECPISGEIIYCENIKKMGFLCGIDEISGSKKHNRAFINLIKYKQSLIADTNHIERVNNELVNHCRVIAMEHAF